MGLVGLVGRLYLLFLSPPSPPPLPPSVQATSRQLWAVVNLLLTVVGSFVFGYFAAYYAAFDVPAVSTRGALCKCFNYKVHP